MSERHANFFQAEPGARAQDVVELVAEVQRRVESETGIRLVPELRPIAFAGQPGARREPRPPGRGRPRGRPDQRSGGMKAVVATRRKVQRRMRRLRAIRVPKPSVRVPKPSLRVPKRALRLPKPDARWLPRSRAGRGFTAVLAVATVAALLWTGSRSALFDVDRIDVVGGFLVSPAEAAEAAGSLERVPLADVDTTAAADRVEALPFVRSARVERVFPNRLRIRLTERRPVAFATRPVTPVAPAPGFALLDDTGRVLADRPDRPADLPEVTGAGEIPPPGEWLRPARSALATYLALTEPLRRQATRAAVDGESITLTWAVATSASVPRSTSRPRWPPSGRCSGTSETGRFWPSMSGCRALRWCRRSVRRRARQRLRRPVPRPEIDADQGFFAAIAPFRYRRYSLNGNRRFQPRSLKLDLSVIAGAGAENAAEASREEGWRWWALLRTIWQSSRSSASVAEDAMQ